MKQTKKLSRKVISYVLALVMVFSTMTGIVPGMSITAQAAPEETLLTTITATGKTTYSESPEGVVNVTLSNIVSYRSSSGWFGGRVTVTPVEGYTITKCRFNADSGAVNDTEEPFTFNNDRNFVKTVEVYGYQTSAQAADPVPYIYYTNNASTEGTCTDYTTVATDTTTWGTAGNTTWYVVSGEVTISSRVTVNGTVNLILRDGAKLTVNGGIGLNDGNTLNIYPETENGTGELNANASSNKCAGIGGTYASSYSVACGTLTIHGGVIKATGAENGPGIGNSGQGYAKATQEAGTVIIYAGNVTATGGNYGSAGIGGGWAYTGGCNVEIYGGTVLANVGDDPVGAQGIGYAGGSKTRYPGTLKIGAGVKVYSDAAGTTEIAAGPQDNVASRTDTMFVKKVKLAQTVTAPTKATDLTYKKDEAQALLTSGAVVKEGNKTEGSIKYKVGDDGTWSSEIPKETNAGTYSVYYKVEGNDTYAEYAPADPISVTIAKADPETPEAFSAIYGQQAKDIKLPTGWSWVNPDIKFESSGGVELKANFEGDANYNQKNNVSIYGTVAKAAFDAEKEAEKKAADALAADGDSDASKKLIEDAKKAINELAYDKSKSVDENKAALAAIVSKLKSDLTDNRAAEKKEADDTAAAKKVTDAINALPASDKVATTDKAAIEAARKAYDALTADQKKKVPADVLKKLTDAETALKAAEKKEAEDAANAATAKKVVDAINKLPVASKVTVPNKAAIEAARKAYNSLTAEQKKNVPADVLKKLTDDEKALAAATAADKAAKELAAAKEEAQAAMNEQVTVTQKGKKFTVKWKKSTSADGYYVYASYCGKKATKPAKTIKKNTTTKVTISKINGKKISTKKNFHVYVVPYKIIDGKKVALGKSTVVHLVGAKSTKYSNVKKLTLKKTKYTVKVGKTAKIKAKVTLVNKNKKHIPKSHGAKFRYKSSDTSIATVDKNGKIKGIKKGKCTIYVYSINGLTKKAQITVK